MQYFPEGWMRGAYARIAAFRSASHDKQRPSWTTRRLMRLLGWPGIVGAGLMVFGVTLYVSALRPAEQQLDQVRHSAVSRQRQLGPAGSQPGSARSPAEQLEQFYRLFPVDTTLPDCVEKIFAAAKSQGIELNQGDYKVTREQVGNLIRFQITLPVKGDYPQIRKFLTGLRNEVPAAAIEQVQFERQKIADPSIEAKIQLALYMERSS